VDKYTEFEMKNQILAKQLQFSAGKIGYGFEDGFLFNRQRMYPQSEQTVSTDGATEPFLAP
jgi:hypothetical protein